MKDFFARLKSNKYLHIIIGIIVIFSGVNLLIVGQKDIWMNYLGIVLLILGIAYLLFMFFPYLKKEYVEKRETLASKFLNLITFRGRLQVFFPLFGIIIIAVDLIYNLMLSGTPQLLTFDTIVLLFGSWLIFHNFIPKKFERERDFVFMFLFFLVLLMVIPLLILRFVTGNFEESVNVYSANLLVPPVVGLSRLFGVPILDVNGIWIQMALKSGQQVWIGITTECSGIFSFAIFASAFMAFVMIEFEKITKKVVALLALGIFTAYLANILRMTIIILVGYHFDTGNLQNMLFAHANLGWIIFLLWISLFWALTYKLLMKEKEPKITKPKKRGVLCGVCSEPLKVDMPGYRCKCGKFYHIDCIADRKKCPNCKRALDIENDAVLQAQST
jgi:exosortase/archaeosortase family protein